MKVFVGGINGVGKTTTLNMVATSLGMKHIKGSSLMMEYIGFPGDYEKLRSLSKEQQDKLWSECAEALLSGNFGDSFLLDAHYLSLNRGKINATVGDWINNFDAIILLSAPIESIWQRITADKEKRDRALFPEGISEETMKELLREHEKVTQTEFEKILKASKKPGIEIINEDGKQDTTVDKLVEFIGRISLQ